MNGERLRKALIAGFSGGGIPAGVYFTMKQAVASPSMTEANPSLAQLEPILVPALLVFGAFVALVVYALDP